MVARYQVVDSKIPASAQAAFDALSRAKQLDEVIAPRFARALLAWMVEVAQTASLDYPRKSGASAMSLPGSARVTGGRSLSSIRGYFLVAPAIAANEYGAHITPRTAQALVIPMPAALRPDGTPKRRGPRSWQSLKTFIYHSKRSGHRYIAYRRGRKLVLLYLLVDEATVKKKRYLRNAYDRLLPQLYAAFAQILAEEIQNVYNASLASSTGQPLRKVSRPPSADKWAKTLLPTYRK